MTTFGSGKSGKNETLSNIQAAGTNSRTNLASENLGPNVKKEHQNNRNNRETKDTGPRNKVKTPKDVKPHLTPFNSVNFCTDFQARKGNKPVDIIIVSFKLFNEIAVCVVHKQHSEDSRSSNPNQRKKKGLAAFIEDETPCVRKSQGPFDQKSFLSNFKKENKTLKKPKTKSRKKEEFREKPQKKEKKNKKKLKMERNIPKKPEMGPQVIEERPSVILPEKNTELNLNFHNSRNT